ncbi:MAG: hypothetical protein EBU97_04620, partial [Rhodobacteraceae bacterium]|nr:hypothetical protein [Paracoccaceae bacterium]
TCFYYQANLVSTEALSAKLWPCGPAAPTDSLFVDFTASAPLNGQLGVISGSGFQAKGMDVPNKLTSQYASVLIKPNVDVGNGVKKNVCELRTYITWDSNSGAFKVVTTGGLITSKKWASGRYEIRAKVANRPAMVWAVQAGASGFASHIMAGLTAEFAACCAPSRQPAKGAVRNATVTRCFSTANFVIDPSSVAPPPLDGRGGMPAHAPLWQAV